MNTKELTEVIDLLRTNISQKEQELSTLKDKLNIYNNELVSMREGQRIIDKIQPLNEGDFLEIKILQGCKISNGDTRHWTNIICGSGTGDIKSTIRPPLANEFNKEFNELIIKYLSKSNIKDE